MSVYIVGSSTQFQEVQDGTRRPIGYYKIYYDILSSSTDQLNISITLEFGLNKGGYITGSQYAWCTDVVVIDGNTGKDDKVIPFVVKSPEFKYTASLYTTSNPRKITKTCNIWKTPDGNLTFNVVPRGYEGKTIPGAGTLRVSGVKRSSGYPLYYKPSTPSLKGKATLEDQYSSSELYYDSNMSGDGPIFEVSEDKNYNTGSSKVFLQALSNKVGPQGDKRATTIKWSDPNSEVFKPNTAISVYAQRGTYGTVGDDSGKLFHTSDLSNPVVVHTVVRLEDEMLVPTDRYIVRGSTSYKIPSNAPHYYVRSDGVNTDHIRLSLGKLPTPIYSNPQDDWRYSGTVGSRSSDDSTYSSSGKSYTYNKLPVMTGGKNIFSYPYSNGTKVSNGITWTVNSDGSIIANGTATAKSYFYLRSMVSLQAGKVFVQGLGDSYSKGINMCVNNIGYVYADDKTVNIPDGYTDTIYLFVNSGATVDNVLIKPPFACYNERYDLCLHAEGENYNKSERVSYIHSESVYVKQSSDITPEFTQSLTTYKYNYAPSNMDLMFKELDGHYATSLLCRTISGISARILDASRNVLDVYDNDGNPRVGNIIPLELREGSNLQDYQYVINYGGVYSDSMKSASIKLFNLKVLERELNTVSLSDEYIVEYTITPEFGNPATIEVKLVRSPIDVKLVTRPYEESDGLNTYHLPDDNEDIVNLSIEYGLSGYRDKLIVTSDGSNTINIIDMINKYLSSVGDITSGISQQLNALNNSNFVVMSRGSQYLVTYTYDASDTEVTSATLKYSSNIPQSGLSVTVYFCAGDILFSMHASKVGVDDPYSNYYLGLEGYLDNRYVSNNYYYELQRSSTLVTPRIGRVVSAHYKSGKLYDDSDRDITNQFLPGTTGSSPGDSPESTVAYDYTNNSYYTAYRTSPSATATAGEVSVIPAVTCKRGNYHNSSIKLLVSVSRSYLNYMDSHITGSYIPLVYISYVVRTGNTHSIQYQVIGVSKDNHRLVIQSPKRGDLVQASITQGNHDKILRLISQFGCKYELGKSIPASIYEKSSGDRLSYPSEDYIRYLINMYYRYSSQYLYNYMGSSMKLYSVGLVNQLNSSREFGVSLNYDKSEYGNHVDNVVGTLSLQGSYFTTSYGTMPYAMYGPSGGYLEEYRVDTTVPSGYVTAYYELSVQKYNYSTKRWDISSLIGSNFQYNFKYSPMTSRVAYINQSLSDIFSDRPVRYMIEVELVQVPHNDYGPSTSMERTTVYSSEVTIDYEDMRDQLLTMSQLVGSYYTSIYVNDHGSESSDGPEPLGPEAIASLILPRLYSENYDDITTICNRYTISCAEGNYGQLLVITDEVSGDAISLLLDYYQEVL